MNFIYNKICTKFRWIFVMGLLDLSLSKPTWYGNVCDYRDFRIILICGKSRNHAGLQCFCINIWLRCPGCSHRAFISRASFRTLRAGRTTLTAGRTALILALVLALILTLIITLILTTATYIWLIHPKSILFKYRSATPLLTACKAFLYSDSY